MNLKKVFVKAMATLSSLVVFMACDIGLGGAVDTEAPSGAIASPDVNAVIRDAFAVKGTWQDDGSVSQITVSLRNTSTNQTTTFPATVDSSGSWICAIDPINSSLVDGNYLATVTIYDEGGHSSTLTRSYTIDNTPPVVILSYLKSKDDTSTEIKTYGQIFSLSGKAADDNNINKIEVKVYDNESCSGEPKATITKLNVPAAIDQNVAVFGSDDYTNIYGSASILTDSVTRWCKIFAYDDAQRYPADGSAQSEADKNGNCQTSYYFQTTIEKLGYDKYKTNDLYAMFNGTYSSDDGTTQGVSASEVSTVKATLAANAISIGTFALNPKNNPTYSVVGLNKVLSEGDKMSEEVTVESTTTTEPMSAFTLTNGSSDSGVSLTITITPGLDNYSIDTDTVKVYLQKCNDSGTLDSTAAKILLGEKSTTVKTLPISTENYTELETNSYYRLLVEGNDTNKNDILSGITSDGKEQIYAFYLAPLNGVIELTVKSAPWGNDVSDFEPATNCISRETTDVNYQKLKVTLEYSYTGDKALNVFRKYNGGDFEQLNTESLDKGTEKTYVQYIAASDLSSYTTITYKLQNEDESSYSRERSITIKKDDTKPVVNENSITLPSASETSNSSFKFEGTASDGDSGIAKVYVKLYDATNETKCVEKEASGTTSWTLQVIKGDTSFADVLESEGKKKAEIWAVDKVGLKSESITKEWVYKTTTPEFKVTGYQLEGDASVTAKVVNLISNTSEFASGKTFNLTGVASDNYGIKSIKLTQTDESGNEQTAEYNSTSSSNTITYENGVWTVQSLPLGGIASGTTKKYTYKFTITDLADLPTETKELTVTIDSENPSLKTITYPGASAFGTESLSGNSYTFKGGYNDKAIGIKSVKYAIVANGSSVSDSDWKETSIDGGVWSATRSLVSGDTDAIAEGKYTLHAMAIDNADNKSAELTRDFCVDKDLPAVTVRVFQGSNSTEETPNSNGTYVITDSVDNFHFEVEATDSNGIKSVTATKTESGTNGTTQVNFTHEDSTNIWKSESFSSEKTYEFVISVEDGSGNDTINGKKTSASATVLFDKTAPTITVTNAATEKSATDKWFTGTGIQYITGTAKDEQSGLKELKIKIDNGAEDTIVLSEDWTYKYNLNSLSSGEENSKTDDPHSIIVTATDKAGLTTTNTYYFRYDKAVPSIEDFTTSKDYLGAEENDTLTITGNVYDGVLTRPVENMSISIINKSDGSTVKKDGSDLTYTPTWESNQNLGKFTYTIPTEDFVEGKYTFTVTATDYAGNPVSKTADIVVDKTLPAFENNGITVGGSAVSALASKWFSKQSVELSVKATDELSGVSTVEYGTEETDSQGTITINWNALNKRNGEYQGTANLPANGKNKLYLRVEDNAGNIKNYNDDGIEINVDTSAPVISTNAYQIGNGDVKTISDSLETVYIRDAIVTLYGVYKDEQSGVNVLSLSGYNSKSGTTQTIQYSTYEVEFDSDGKPTGNLAYTDDSENSATVLMSAATFENYNAANAVKYKSWKAVFTPDGEGTNKIVVSGTNIASGTANSTFTMIRDVTPPSMPTLSFRETDAGTDVYKAENGNYYTNNSGSKKYTLSGTASDKYGVASVVLGSSNISTVSNSGTAEDWSFTNFTISGSDGDTETITGTITDNAGNTTPISITVVIDTTAPTGVHFFDNNNKDVFFRIGTNDNDDIKSGDSLWKDSLDKDVGGKYSSGTFGNAQTIKIRGTFVDVTSGTTDLLGSTEGSSPARVNGSGVKMIYYEVYGASSKPTADNATALADLATRVRSNAKTITPKSESETRRVFYTANSNEITSTNSNNVTNGNVVNKTFKLKTESNHKVGSKYYKDIESTFDETIGGFTSGENYLVLVAEDYAGNYGVDVVTVTNSEGGSSENYNNFSINVDQKNPEITSDSAFKNTIFTNRTNSTTIYGIATDTPTNSSINDAAGVSSVVIEVNGHEITKDDSTWGTITLDQSGTEGEGTNAVTYTKYKSKWTVEINASAFPETSDNITVYATVTDSAGTGNTQKVSVATVNVDTDAPAASIATPTDADKDTEGIQINGTITLSGSTTDTNGVNRIVGLLYKVDSAATMTAPEKQTDFSTTKDLSGWSVPSGWTKVSTTLAGTNSNTSWTASDIDTSKLDGTTSIDDGSKVWFTVAVQDNAGNIGYSTPISVIVDQDTDRPVIKLNTMTLPDAMSASARLGYENSEFSGTLSDDDGVPTAFSYRLGTTASYGTTNLNYSTSDGSFSLTLDDGEKDIYFKVTDASGKEFETKVFAATPSASDLLVTPKLTDKAGTKYGYKADDSTVKNTVLYMTVDTMAPESKDVKYTRTPDDSTTWSSVISSEQFGGTHNTFYLQQYAYDANGVKKVYLSLPVDSKDDVSTAITAWSYTDTNTKKKVTVYTSGNQPTTSTKCYSDYDAMTGTGTEISAVAADFATITAGSNTYTREAYIYPLSQTSTKDGEFYLWETPYASGNNKPVDVTNLESGNRTASVISYDGIRSSSNTLSIAIDNTKPVISFTGPSETDSQSGGAGITVYGSVDSKADVYYAVSTSGEVSPDSSDDVTQWESSTDVKTNLTTSLKNNTASYTEGSVDYKYYQYKKIDDASLSWFVYFDETVKGSNSAEKGEHQLTLNKYLVNYGITTDEAITTSDTSAQFSTIVKLYVWIKAVDERGNVTETARLVNVDPQGDKPKITFSYPGEDGKTYGGNVQISGSANDPAGSTDDKIGIESVWMQIIANKHGTENGGTFTTNETSKAVESFSITQNDLDYLKDKYDIYNMKTYHTEASHTKYTGTIANGYSASDYAIRISPEGSSWNQSINLNKEFDVTDGTNGIAVRIYAQDKDGKFSVQKDRYMIFDAQNPIVGSPQALYLIQSADAYFGTSTDEPDFGATASREYTADMFVRGQWYLIGSVTDNDKIKTLTVNSQTLVSYSDNTALSANTIVNGDSYSTWTSADKSIVYFKYKLSTTEGVGALSFNIYVEDQATPTAGKTTKEMSIKYDNTAPVLSTAGDSAYKLSPNVVQSNGFYRLESKVTEDAVNGSAQSGLDYVAFYFMRRNTVSTEVDTIYNPMLKNDNSAVVSASTTLMGAATESDIVYDSGLYWKKETVTRSDTLNQLGVTTKDMYMRKGGRVKIGGSVYTITDKTASSVTLSGNPPKTETTAYFAIALIVDHTSPESGSTSRDSTTGYPSTITNDDGDGMVDYVEKSGTSYTWSAEIVSKNIPDGPIELHYVAFDAAGNYSIGIMGNETESDYRTKTALAQTPDRTEYNDLYSNDSRTSNILYVDGTNNVYNKNSTTAIANDLYKKASFVANNAPRLAAVKIWTDYNGDNSEQTDEIKTKYCNQLKDVSGNYIDYAGGVTSTFIVSGNNNDYTDETKGTAYMTIRDKTTFTPEIVGGNGVLNYKSRIAKAAELANKTYSELSSNWISGTNVQVEETDYMNGTYVDMEKTRRGNIVFGSTEAEWTALGSNSTEADPYWFEYVIWDSTEGTVAGTNSLSATMRIALNVDYFDETAPWAKINPFYWVSKSNNSLVWNGDGDTPLGHIELESDLNDTIKNTKVNGTEMGDDPKVSGQIKIEGTAYDNIRLKALYAKFTDHSEMSTYQLIGEYNGSWENKSGTGWSSTVTDVSADSNGHLAKWTVTIDTAQASTVVGLDRAFTVFAVDARGTATDTTTISGTTITGNSSVSTIGTTQTSVVESTWSNVKDASDATKNYYTDKLLTTLATSSTEDGATVYSANGPYYKMDVVPYVSKVYTKLAKNKVTNWSVYNRTALGHYPVQSVVSNIDSNITLNTSTSEDVTLYGFNLNTDTAKIVSGSNTFTVGNADDSLKITSDATAGTLSFNVAKLSSGELNLTVGGLALLNNINNNDAKGSATAVGTAYANCYNRQPNGDTNNILTDDIEFDVWEFNDRAAVPINGTATGINMEINQKTGMLNYAFANGGVYYSMGGNIDNTNEYSTTSYSSYYWAGDYDTFAGPCVGFHVDDLGYTYSVVSGGDTNTSGSVDKWVLYSSRWGYLGRNFYGTLNGNNSLRLEEIALKLGNHKDNLNYSLMKYRYLSPEFASTVSGTNTNLYLVYYDALCNQIRFRAGTFSTTSKQVSGGFQDEYTEGASSYYSTKNCQIIANGSSGGTFIQDDQGTTKTVPAISGRGAGQYVDVAVVKNGTTDVVCVVWYDADSNNCKFSYITDPISSWTSLAGNETALNWSNPVTVFDEGGEYCHIVADKNNHLHIAAYAGNGDVMYAYIDALTESKKDVKTCTVDASGAVGEHLTLDVALNSKGNAIPYIGYYTSAIKKPKYAYLVDPTIKNSTVTFTQVSDGVDSNERFTGTWEVVVVPTPSRMTTNREDKVNVGVWKNEGTLKNSTTGTSQIYNAGTGYTSVNWSKTYGNGTANGVLGYQISTSSGTGLETAQMR